jgi:predicted pyridoxine 5'-phosphate oxidase superfamily flavin-nucleotide-binding protein
MPYSRAQRGLQDTFDARRLADRIDERLVHAELSADDRALIERLDLFFLATADGQGRPTCSYKGGDPGFVKVLDAKSLAFPSWDGNGMFLSAGNLIENPNVGLLFIDFQKPSRLRVEGTAELVREGGIVKLWPEAQLAVLVHVERAYPNCGRYVHELQLVKRSRFVPRDGCQTPSPSWKGSDWARDVLPKK